MSFAEFTAASAAMPGRSGWWRVLIAAAAGLVLLLSFRQVVREAVQVGEMRRHANALLADATWRCNAFRRRSLREDCLQQLAEVPRENARLQPVRVALAASAVLAGR